MQLNDFSRVEAAGPPRDVSSVYNLIFEKVSHRDASERAKALTFCIAYTVYCREKKKAIDAEALKLEALRTQHRAETEAPRKKSLQSEIDEVQQRLDLLFSDFQLPRVVDSLVADGAIGLKAVVDEVVSDTQKTLVNLSTDLRHRETRFYRRYILRPVGAILMESAKFVIGVLLLIIAINLIANYSRPFLQTIRHILHEADSFLPSPIPTQPPPKPESK